MVLISGILLDDHLYRKIYRGFKISPVAPFGSVGAEYQLGRSPFADSSPTPGGGLATVINTVWMLCDVGIVASFFSMDTSISTGNIGYRALNFTHYRQGHS